MRELSREEGLYTSNAEAFESRRVDCFFFFPIFACRETYILCIWTSRELLFLYPLQLFPIQMSLFFLYNFSSCFFFFLPLIRDNEMKMMIINLGKTNYKPKKQFSSVLAQYTEENKMYFTWMFLVSLFEILFNYQTQRRCLCTIGDRERTSRSSSLQMRDKTLQFPYLELKKVKPICSEYIWFIHMCISSHSGHYACNIRKGMSQAADSRKSSV